MKSILVFLLTLIPLADYAQQNYPCTFKVVDARTKKPIYHASVTIDQISANTQLSDVNELCSFQSVPSGRIDVTISHDDHKPERLQYTISSEVKNNSFIIELTAFSENSLMIYGKVTAENDLAFEGVNVEIKIDGKPYTSKTDKGGNFLFDLTLPVIRNDRIQMEVTKSDCKYTEEISLPERRMIIKNIKLGCGSSPKLKEDESDAETGSVLVKNEINQNLLLLLDTETISPSNYNRTYMELSVAAYTSDVYEGLKPGVYYLCAVYDRATIYGCGYSKRIVVKKGRQETVTIKSYNKN